MAHAIFHSRPRPGQSMLEAMLAIGIIVTSVASSITVVSGAIGAEKDSESTIIGVNLGREGIEVVREIRDSNWLANAAWDQGISGDGTQYVGVPVFDPVQGSWTIDYGTQTLDEDGAHIYRYATGSGAATVGLMVQAASQPDGTAVTAFRRIVEVYPLCEDGSIMGSGSACGSGNPKVGIQVVSRVRWSTSGRTRNAVVEERLYDWR